MRRIGAGMVAENSAIWRVAGVFFSTASTSSMKPMRSISSASSSTRQLQLRQVERAAVEVVDDAARRADDDVHAALAAPAAAGRSSGRRRSAARGSRAGASAYFWKASATWIASSRVGASTSACGLLLRRGRCAPGSAARTPRSCRCRSAPGRARRGRPAAAGWWRPGSARAIRSRRRPGRAAAARAGRGR